VLIFATYGAVFLSLKLTGDLADRAARLARRLWPFAAVAQIAFFLSTYVATDLLSHIGINPGPLPFAMIGALLVAGLFILRGRLPGWTFALLAFSIAAQTAFTFGLLFPRVMVSSLDPAYSLTIYTAASSPYTLTVMTGVALFFVPLVVGYQAWTYWIFRKRVEAKPEGLVY
jgi:cytochrome d ubiquinol oxidase subunit II